MTKKSFLVGFSEADITPATPVLLAGYYHDRRSTAIHDRLFARSMAVSDGESRVVICAADLVELDRGTVAETRRLVKEKCGLPPERLILAAVHTHTGPDLAREKAYAAALSGALAESVRLALENLAPRILRVARGEETTLQFIRRYRMKDGTVRTNPGILNPDVLAPIGRPNPELRVLLALEDGRAVGGLAHYALHCDTAGGTEISADWTHYLRERMKERLGRGLVLLTPIGPAGDVNHWNVFSKVSLRGFAETERIGGRLADAALKALDEAATVRPGRVCGVRREIEARVRVPSATELVEARRLLAQAAPENADFTMDRVEATRRVEAAQAGRSVTLDVTVLAFGEVALAAVPAEYFTELGRSIQERSPFEHTLVCSLGNGCIGYVAARQNYEEGGYETTSSLVAPGTGEVIADATVELLKRAKRRKGS